MVYLFYNKNDKKIDFDVERNNNVTNPTDYSKEINELKEKYNNDDVVGILSFDNTDYSAPIMQGEDNEYYLNHTPDKEDNYMGSIYLIVFDLFIVALYLIFIYFSFLSILLLQDL